MGTLRLLDQQVCTWAQPPPLSGPSALFAFNYTLVNMEISTVLHNNENQVNCSLTPEALGSWYFPASACEVGRLPARLDKGRYSTHYFMKSLRLLFSNSRSSPSRELWQNVCGGQHVTSSSSVWVWWQGVGTVRIGVSVVTAATWGQSETAVEFQPPLFNDVLSKASSSPVRCLLQGF